MWREPLCWQVFLFTDRPWLRGWKPREGDSPIGQVVAACVPLPSCPRPASHTSDFADAFLLAEVCIEAVFNAMPTSIDVVQVDLCYGEVFLRTSQGTLF